MTARDALRVATRGGAQVLGRPDIGHLAVGMCADLAVFDLGTLAFAGGAVHDPVGALLLCASPQAAYTVVNGRVVVRQGQLTTLELGPLIERHNVLARQLAFEMFDCFERCDWVTQAYRTGTPPRKPRPHTLYRVQPLAPSCAGS